MVWNPGDLVPLFYLDLQNIVMVGTGDPTEAFALQTAFC